MKAEVIIQIFVEGYHQYIGAPPDVSFLKHKHRHTFRITCGYRVDGLNREREIFICRERMREYLYGKYGDPCEFKDMSCEMIAADIVMNTNGVGWCEVWEEDTGGARVEI